MTSTLGAALRSAAAANGAGTQQHDTLTVRLSCDGCRWALELRDAEPVAAGTFDAWRRACDAPVFGVWTGESEGRVLRLVWTEQAKEGGEG